MPGDDHPGAMTPGTLAKLIHRINRVESMLGSSEIKLPKVEGDIIGVIRTTLKEVDYND